MADLKFDTSVFSTTAKGYRDNAGYMAEVEKNLKTMIKNLNDTDWRSTAGEAFQNMYQDDWSAIVDKYVAVLQQMADLLDKTKKDYDALAAKAKDLKVDTI